MAHLGQDKDLREVPILEVPHFCWLPHKQEKTGREHFFLEYPPFMPPAAPHYQKKGGSSYPGYPRPGEKYTPEKWAPTFYWVWSTRKKMEDPSQEILLSLALHSQENSGIDPQGIPTISASYSSPWKGERRRLASANTMLEKKTLHKSFPFWWPQFTFVWIQVVGNPVLGIWKLMLQKNY